MGNERPSTGLGPDAGARKWILGGVGASCLLTAAFVLLASHDVAPAHAAAIETPPEPSSEREPAPSEAKSAPSEPASLVAPSPAPRPKSESHSVRPVAIAPAQPSIKSDATLAAGSSVAVQTQTRAPATPKPAATPKPTATPAPVELDETPSLPRDPSPAGSNAELPDVEPWDEADDEASSADAAIPATPS